MNRSKGVACDATILPVDDFKKLETTLDDGLLRLQAQRLKSCAELKFGNLAEEIAQYAEEIHADLIVLGHRRQAAC